MADVTCINPSIDVFRTRDGFRLENYTFGSSVFFLRWRSGRVGGCWDAQFNVIRAVNEVGTLQKGDKIDIKFKGVQHWTGYVNDFVSRDKDLEVRCIGAWVALNTIFPTNAIYGTEADFDEADNENEFADLATAQEILEHLYDGYLGSSDITKTGLSGADPSHQEARLDVNGTFSLSALAQRLALNAGDWGTGIDEDLDWYLVDPGNLGVTQFRTCDDATFRITAMEKQESIAWVDYPTRIVINGAGGFSEAFNAENFGYPSERVTIAGIVLTNEKIVSLPGIGETEEKTYTPIRGTDDLTVKSIDAARHADGIFLGRSLVEPEDYIIEANRVNSLLRPWVNRIRIFDNFQQDRGVFVIESIEYESQDADISIALMEVKKSP